MFSYKESRLEDYDPSIEENTELMDLVREGREVFIKEFNTPLTHIYVDFKYLRDWKLGALLAIANDDEKSIIAKYLDQYNDRIHDLNICGHFPGLPYTDSDIDRVCSDPTYTDGLLLKSPTTLVYAHLHEFMSMVFQHNRRIEQVSPVKLCINFYPFTPSTLVKNVYARILHSIHPQLKLNVMSTKLSTIPNSALRLDNNTMLFKTMFIYDLQDFLSEDSNHAKSFLELLHFNSVSVFAPKHVGEVDLEEVVIDLDQKFKTTKAVLDICSNFDYLSPVVR